MSTGGAKHPQSRDKSGDHQRNKVAGKHKTQHLSPKVSIGRPRKETSKEVAQPKKPKLFGYWYLMSQCHNLKLAPVRKQKPKKSALGRAV